MAYDVPFPEVERDLPICLEIRGLLGFLGVFLGGRFPSGTAKMGSNLRRFFKFSWKMSPLLAKFTQAHRISNGIPFKCRWRFPKFLVGPQGLKLVPLQIKATCDPLHYHKTDG